MDRVGYASIALYSATRKYPRVPSSHASYVGFESDIARAYLGPIPPESMSAHSHPGGVLTGNYLEKCIPGLARKRESDQLEQTDCRNQIQGSFFPSSYTLRSTETPVALDKTNLLIDTPPGKDNEPNFSSRLSWIGNVSLILRAVTHVALFVANRISVS